MLDLGRAEVAMGSGSLEHEGERKAVDALATLRPSDSLGQGRPTASRLSAIIRTVQSPSNSTPPRLTSLRGQAAVHVARVGPLFAVVDHPGSHEPDGIAPGGYIARDGGKALVFQRSVERFDTGGRACESDGGVGGKRIDDTESTKPDALVAPAPLEKSERLEVDVGETPRIRCHDATLASSLKGLTPFDLIADELETSSELR